MLHRARAPAGLLLGTAEGGQHGAHPVTVRRFDVDEHELDPAIVPDGPLPVELPPRSDVLAFACRDSPTLPGESDFRVDQVLVAAAEVDSRRK